MVFQKDALGGYDFTSKSSEIGRNIACFWPLKFFWDGPLKFWTGIIKFRLVLTSVQNFAPIGDASRRSISLSLPGGGLKSKVKTVH